MVKKVSEGDISKLWSHCGEILDEKDTPEVEEQMLLAKGRVEELAKKSGTVVYRCAQAISAVISLPIFALSFICGYIYAKNSNAHLSLWDRFSKKFISVVKRDSAKGNVRNFVKTAAVGVGLLISPGITAACTGFDLGREQSKVVDSFIHNTLKIRS